MVNGEGELVSGSRKSLLTAVDWMGHQNRVHQLVELVNNVICEKGVMQYVIESINHIIIVWLLCTPTKR